MTLHHGDCLEVMPTLDANSIDAIVTDPPYGLSFMGKAWDHGVPGEPFWREALRVAKPGAHLLASGGTRTFHRLTCAIEDAGWEIRDCLSWLYGCLSDDAEILTAEGWATHDRVQEQQLVAAFNTATGELRWERVATVYRYQHAGPMVEVGPQLVTLNHRVVLESAREPEVPLPGPADLRCLWQRLPDVHARGGVLASAGVVETLEGTALLEEVQRHRQGPGVGEARSQGRSSRDARGARASKGEDDRAAESSLAGRRYRVQEAWELLGSEVRQGAGVGTSNGEERRLHHGAPASDGPGVRIPLDADRVRQPREPQSSRQPARESDAVAGQPDTQTLRVGLGPTGDSDADPVRLTDYRGIVWCVSVPSGAFVARRNGVAFVTGNSGFPKSLDVSKAIDRARGDDPSWREVGRWLKAKREGFGHSRQSLAPLLPGYKNIESAAADISNWENGLSFPTLDRWLLLKRLLLLPNDMDAEVWRLNGRKGQPGEAWHERPITGRHDGHAFAEWESNCGIERSDTPKERRDIPATALARQWDGWGTALKPGWEPVILARKPLIGTVAANVAAHGTGGLNIDGCRVEGESTRRHTFEIMTSKGAAGGAFGNQNHEYDRRDAPKSTGSDSGRWPANVVLDEEAAAMLDEQSGVIKSGTAVGGLHRRSNQTANCYGHFAGERTEGDVTYGDTGGASRFFYTAKASRSEREFGLEGGPKVKSRSGLAGDMPVDDAGRDRDRFQVEARNHHPTVKPVALMRWLCRLVTPPNGLILDPFMGSGSTGVAAALEGFRFVGIEKEAEYLEIARRRIEAASAQTTLGLTG